MTTIFIHHIAQYKRIDVLVSILWSSLTKLTRLVHASGYIKSRSEMHARQSLRQLFNSFVRTANTPKAFHLSMEGFFVCSHLKPLFRLLIVYLVGTEHTNISLPSSSSIQENLLTLPHSFSKNLPKQHISDNLLQNNLTLAPKIPQ